MHAGNVGPTLFFFWLVLGVCLRNTTGICRYAQTGGGRFDLAGSELRKAQRCVSNWLGVLNGKQQHSSIKERLAPGWNELQPP